MGIDVHPQTMQDKKIGDNPDYATKELRGYGFKLVKCPFNYGEITQMVNYVVNGKADKATAATDHIQDYIEAEHKDRLSPASNPGNAFRTRPEVWEEFLHDGKFAYTYSERFYPQLCRILKELREKPETRQAILNIHSNICPIPQYAVGEAFTRNTGKVWGSADMENMGGNGRIPCSMYYQFMIREGALDLIYTMRSCDFLTHFPVDFALAMKMQTHVANELGGMPVGTFTYFAGSFHAYAIDLKKRNIF